MYKSIYLFFFIGGLFFLSIAILKAQSAPDSATAGVNKQTIEKEKQKTEKIESKKVAKTDVKKDSALTQSSSQVAADTKKKQNNKIGEIENTKLKADTSKSITKKNKSFEVAEKKPLTKEDSLAIEENRKIGILNERLDSIKSYNEFLYCIYDKRRKIYKKQKDDLQKLTKEIADFESQNNRLKNDNNFYKLIDYTAISVNYYNKPYDIVIVNTRIIDIRMGWKSRKEPKKILSNLRAFVDENRPDSCIFAFNAGMYTPNQEPEGLFYENKKKISNIDTVNPTKEYLNYYLDFGKTPKSNGIFYVDTTRKVKIVFPRDFKKDLENKVCYATQSGPVLLKGTKINPNFSKKSNNLNIRNGVGVINDSLAVFAISNEAISLYSFASLFKDLGCTDALYLDGAISQGYIPKIKRSELGGHFGVMVGGFIKRVK